MSDDNVRFEVEYYERRRRAYPAGSLRTILLTLATVFAILLLIVLYMVLTAEPVPSPQA